MVKLSKKRKMIGERIEAQKLYPFDEAVTLLQELPKARFEESFDVSVRLGVDPRKSDQVVRGATDLPNGTGKTVRVAVFAQGANAEAAAAAGADIVGFEDLAERIKKGEMNFDVLIASPDSMRIVGQLGPILGPRSLMPNPKVGTVTPHVADAVQKAKAGQVRYRTDKNGIIHCAIGKVDFESQTLKENLNALITDLKKAKPATSKGVYLRKISVSTTMGPGLLIDQASLA